jgi:hypothetical protein
MHEKAGFVASVATRTRSAGAAAAEVRVHALQQGSRVDRPPSTPWWRRHCPPGLCRESLNLSLTVLHVYHSFRKLQSHREMTSSSFQAAVIPEAVSTISNRFPVRELFNVSFLSTLSQTI